MEEKKKYYSIENTARSEIKLRRSVFICTLKPVDSIAHAKQFISETSKANKTASHNCWAYIVGEKGELFHSSDAGEPSGTAGKPMLNALWRYELTNVAAVVTRIYGGVKLGVRGLMDAYFQSVEEAAGSAGRVRLVRLAEYQVGLAYDFNDIFINKIKKFDARITATQYLEQIRHTFQVNADTREPVIKLLKTYASKGQLEIIKGDGFEEKEVDTRK